MHRIKDKGGWKMATCPDCKGKGRGVCNECMGTKKGGGGKKCPYCKGSGVGVCVKCQGRGKI